MQELLEKVCPFSVLGVPLDATTEQIADAYRLKKATAVRTDPNQVVFLTEAFEALRDPEQRAKLARAATRTEPSRESREKADPFSVLGVPLSATQDQIADAYRQRKAAAARSDPAKLIQINAAFEILKDPAQREQLARTVMKKEVLETLPEEVKGSAQSDRRSVRSAAVKWSSLAVLLLIFAATTFQALRPKNAYCPVCTHLSVAGEQQATGDVKFSCTRVECDFTYTYDPAADAEYESDEHSSDHAQLTE